MRVERRQRRACGPDRAAVAWGAYPPLRWAGAVGRVGRGGQDLVRLPVSPRPRPSSVVGARPPPRGQTSRPTSLAADTTGVALNLGVFYHAVSCRCVPRSLEAASGAAEAWRWAGPQPQRGPAMRVACRQHRGVGAGSRRRSVGRSSTAALGGRHRLRGARRAGTRYACQYRRAHARQVRWAPTRRPAANPAAQPRSQQTPLARPSTWALCMALSCAYPRLAVPKLPAALLKRVVGRSLTPYAPGHARAVPPAPRRGCRIAPRERGALMRGCVGRAPSVAARGGPARCRRPYSPRVPPACAVGARPPPRGHGRRPTALAADTAGAADNLGVFYTAVACRCAPRSIAPASGAAEAGRWAVPQPERFPGIRLERRQGRRVGRIAPRERGRLLDGCGGRAPSVAARGGPARCSRP